MCVCVCVLFMVHMCACVDGVRDDSYFDVCVYGVYKFLYGRTWRSEAAYCAAGMAECSVGASRKGQTDGSASVCMMNRRQSGPGWYSRHTHTEPNL